MRKIIKIESPGSSDYDVSVGSVSSDGASQKNKQTNTKANKNKNKKNVFFCLLTLKGN
jgi:hypothetical protein